MKDKRSLLLLLVCIVLVLTWAYHLYDKSRYMNQRSAVISADTLIPAAIVSDSLKNIFSARLEGIQKDVLRPDSAGNFKKTELTGLLSEIHKQKSAVDSMLNKKFITPSDWRIVLSKINTIQILIDSAEQLNNGIFSGIKEELSSTINRLNTEVRPVEKLSRNDLPETKAFSPKTSFIMPEFFSVQEIKLAAVRQASGEQWQETRMASNAEKLNVSFTLLYKASDLDNAEIIAVLTDPSGKTIIPDVWDAGSFESKSEGRKMYSRKIKFAYKKGELKKISFSLQPDLFEKGIYRLQLYQHGVLLGESKWALS